MLNTKFAAKLAASSLAVALLSGALSQPAAAYQCKRVPTYAKGYLKMSQGVAKASARAAWTAKVKSKYHLSWSVWKIAQNQAIPCAKEGVRWRCTAKAKPCKYVVF